MENPEPGGKCADPARIRRNHANKISIVYRILGERASWLWCCVIDTDYRLPVVWYARKPWTEHPDRYHLYRGIAGA